MIRRRLALWLDPSLKYPEPPRLQLDFGRSYEIARNTERIAIQLERINDKTLKRPRNTWCLHPELHPMNERGERE